MALEKAWVYAPSYVLGNASTRLDVARNVLWFTKAVLLSQISMLDQSGSAVGVGSAPGKWSMYYSCDGTTAGTANDGVDRLGGGTYNAAKWVRDTAGNAHSWMVLKSPSSMPGGAVYLCVSYEGNNDHNALYVTSPNAFTGGTTTARPTAVNEAVNTANTFSWTGADGTTGPCKGHGILAADGACFLLASKDGTGFFFSLFHLSGLADVDVSETIYRVFTFLSESDSGTIAGALGNISNINNWGGRSATGIACSQLAAIAPQYNGSLYALDVIDATSNAFRDFPIFMHTNTPSSWRGRFVDWKFACTVMVDGDVEPLTGSIQRMVVGDTWMPARQAPSL